MTAFTEKVRAGAVKALSDPDYWEGTRPKFCNEFALLATHAQKKAWTAEDASIALASQAILTASLGDEDTTVDQIIDSTMTAALYRHVTMHLMNKEQDHDD